MHNCCNNPLTSLFSTPLCTSCSLLRVLLLQVQKYTYPQSPPIDRSMDRSLSIVKSITRRGGRRQNGTDEGCIANCAPPACELLWSTHNVDQRVDHSRKRAEVCICIFTFLWLFAALSFSDLFFIKNILMRWLQCKFTHAIRFVDCFFARYLQINR